MGERIDDTAEEATKVGVTYGTNEKATGRGNSTSGVNSSGADTERVSQNYIASDFVKVYARRFSNLSRIV